jgi:hypothetical protein
VAAPEQVLDPRYKDLVCFAEIQDTLLVTV